MTEEPRIKICSICRQAKRIDEFYLRKRGPRAGKFYERCCECFKSRGRKYYHDNRQRQLALALKRKSRYRLERKMFIENLKKQPCIDCGKIYPPWVMDFDHKDQATKIASISWLALHDTANLEKIKLEIAKCDLVCANCHRNRTYQRLKRVKSAAVAKLVKALV